MNVSRELTVPKDFPVSFQQCENGYYKSVHGKRVPSRSLVVGEYGGCPGLNWKWNSREELESAAPAPNLEWYREWMDRRTSGSHGTPARQRKNNYERILVNRNIRSEVDGRL